MTCTVKVEGGMISLPGNWQLPDGVEVQLTVSDESVSGTSFADRYAKYIGAADDLPADLAENLDHYVHGLSKK